MSIYAPGTFSGNYRPSPQHELSQGSYVIGHEFASRQAGPGIVNEALAAFIAERYADKRLYVATSIASALEEIAPEITPTGIFDIAPSDTTARRGGTWEELQQAIRFEGTDARPIHVGQAFHVPRIGRQSEWAGLDPLIPEGLPAIFDEQSDQWWCRNRRAWGARESVGVWALYLNRQIGLGPAKAKSDLWLPS